MLQVENADRGFSTMHEMAFIDGIGMGVFAAKEMNLDRRETLMGYLGAAKKRVRWGNIDQVVAIAHAEKALRETAK